MTELSVHFYKTLLFSFLPLYASQTDRHLLPLKPLNTPRIQTYTNALTHFFFTCALILGSLYGPKIRMFWAGFCQISV